MSVLYLDAMLARYYRKIGEQYDDALGIGKFLSWCALNGYDTYDNDTNHHRDKYKIKQQLNKQPHECLLVHFDDDFPTFKKDEERIKEIFYIMQYCFENKRAFKDQEELKYHKPARIGNKEQIDIGLSRYYAHKSIQYFNNDGIGKFMEWCDDNGYDDDNIAFELQQDPQDFILHEFDDDFPSDNTGIDKVIEICKIIEYCWYFDDAFTRSTNIIAEKDNWYSTGFIAIAPNPTSYKNVTLKKLCHAWIFTDHGPEIVLRVINDLYDKQLTQKQYHWNLRVTERTQHEIFMATKRRVGKKSIFIVINSMSGSTLPMDIVQLCFDFYSFEGKFMLETMCSNFDTINRTMNVKALELTFTDKCSQEWKKTFKLGHPIENEGDIVINWRCDSPLEIEKMTIRSVNGNVFIYTEQNVKMSKNSWIEANGGDIFIECASFTIEGKSVLNTYRDLEKQRLDYYKCMLTTFLKKYTYKTGNICIMAESVSCNKGIIASLNIDIKCKKKFMDTNGTTLMAHNLCISAESICEYDSGKNWDIWGEKRLNYKHVWVL